MFVEAGGGYLSNSLALLSDAAHMGSDAAALLLSLFTFWMGKKPSTPRRSYGYQRLEILGALVSAFAIWMVAIGLVYESVKRLSAPPDVNGPIVFVIATVGLIINLVGLKWLHHDHQHSIGIKAAYLHLISDLLGSIGAMIAGALLWWSGWKLIDPIVTLLFSVLMVLSTWELIKDSVNILMESAPKSVDPIKIRNSLMNLKSVCGVHDLHIWSVNSQKMALSAHIVTQDDHPSILKEAQDLLKNQYFIAHTTLQIENKKHFDASKCFDCQNDEIQPILNQTETDPKHDHHGHHKKHGHHGHRH